MTSFEFKFTLLLLTFDLGYGELLVDAFLEVGEDQSVIVDADLHDLIDAADVVGFLTECVMYLETLLLIVLRGSTV